jgi:hypothetical protein
MKATALFPSFIEHKSFAFLEILVRGDAAFSPKSFDRSTRLIVKTGPSIGASCPRISNSQHLLSGHLLLGIIHSLDLKGTPIASNSSENEGLAPDGYSVASSRG